MTKIWYILFLVQVIWYQSSYCETKMMEEKKIDTHSDQKVFFNNKTRYWKIYKLFRMSTNETKAEGYDGTNGPPSNVLLRLATLLHFRLFGEQPRNDDIKRLFDQANIIAHLINSYENREVDGKFPTFEEILELIAPKTENFCQPKSIDCNATAAYRTPDGTCNNLENKHMGAADTAFARFLPAEYGDTLNCGTAIKDKGESGAILKSPRIISNIVFKSDAASPKSENITVAFVHFGQFVDHDITLTPTETEDDGTAIECCDGHEPITREECASFYTPQGEFTYNCMGFVRSRPACKFGPREQMNGITAWIDASNVYGSSFDETESLKADKGKLRLGQNNELLPDDESDCGTTSKCFYAGDVRNSEIGPLTTFHLIWVKEHNRIADKFQDKGWNDEKIFQETRKIVIAMMQKIVYNEFLPLVVGQQWADDNHLTSSPTGLTTIYDPTVDATIKNGFATAAYRFGHSMVTNEIGYSNSDFEEKTYSSMNESFFNTHYIRDGVNYGPENMGRWMSSTCGKKMDRFISEQLRDHLFEEADKLGLDLGALNIQRGRDHGLPGYNKFREYCGLQKASKFDNTEDGFVDQTPESVQKLKEAYSDPDDVELIVGGMSEKPAPGAIVGPLFRCLIGEQFRRLKFGDRFFYDNSNPPWFTEEQVNEIKKQTMAAIYCRTLGIEKVQPNIFLKPEEDDRVLCNSLPDLDFTKF